MAKTRLDKTLADYMVIAISPALVMTLVGSLVFFLLEVCYRGSFETRMHWIMFWYVFGAVLVSRIAIEEGRERALLFGMAMCAVVALAILYLVDAVIVGWILLAVIWWCSSKLTWDCTLIDETEDASGKGLLQSAGLDPIEGDRPHVEETLQIPLQAVKPVVEPNKKRKKQQPPTAEMPNPGDPKSAGGQAADESLEQKQPHTPGLWIVYFSLAALPLFGIGQVFIPANEYSRRSHAFQLLAIYVGSAIALLLTTSFLGLRLLRQRKLVMPAAMARSWLGLGMMLLVALLLAAVLIPRPQGEYTLTAMIDKIDSKARQASKHAILKNDRAEGEGRKIGDQAANAKEPGEQDRNGDPKSSGNKQGQSNNQSSQKSQRSDSGEKQSRRADQQQSDSKTQKKSSDRSNNPTGDNRNVPRSPDQPQPQANPQTQPPMRDSVTFDLARTLASLVKWIAYGLLAIVGMYFLMRYWSQLSELLGALWAELMSLFGRQRQPKDKQTASDSNPAALPHKRPFASFENPFFSGAADRMSPPQLIRYTFEALEAWSRERAVERPPEQTPLEFAEELSRRVPKMAKNVTQAALLYTHIAYSRKSPPKRQLEVLESLWRQLYS